MDFRSFLKKGTDSTLYETFYFGDITLSIQGDITLSIQIADCDRHLKTNDLMFFTVACWRTKIPVKKEDFQPYVPIRNIVSPELAEELCVFDDIPYGLTVEQTQKVFEAFVDYGYRYLEQFR